MPKIFIDKGYLVVAVRHLLKKPEGSFFYQRRIPSDLQKHYGQRTHIRESLKTRDMAVAAKRIGALVRRDDALWLAMRRDGSLSPPVVTHAAQALLKSWDFEPGVKREWYEDDFHDKMLEKYGDDYYGIQVDPALAPEQRDEAINRLITPSEREAHRLHTSTEKPKVRLSTALAMYLDTHSKGSQRKFAQGTTLALQITMAALGDLPLSDITRTDARRVRDAIPGTTGTKRRRLRTINAVFNKAISEFGLSLKNPFHQLEVPNEGLDTTDRIPFTIPELQVISEACRAKDDDIRWIIAMQVETGARLGEIVGLRVGDMFTNDPIPHIYLRPHKALGRTLKNSSERAPRPTTRCVSLGCPSGSECLRAPWQPVAIS